MIIGTVKGERWKIIETMKDGVAIYIERLN